MFEIIISAMNGCGSVAAVFMEFPATMAMAMALHVAMGVGSVRPVSTDRPRFVT